MVVPSTVLRDWWCPQRCAERCCASLCAAGSLQASRGLTPHTGLPASLQGCCHTATVYGLGSERLRPANPNTRWCGFGGAVAAFDAPLIGFASRAQTEAASRDHRCTMMAAATMIARTVKSVSPAVFAGPSRGVGRVRRYDRQTAGGRHRSDRGFEFGGGDARCLASELFGSFAASEGFTAVVSGVGEVEILDTDRSASRRHSHIQQFADSGSQLSEASGGVALLGNEDGDGSTAGIAAARRRPARRSSRR